MPAGFVVQPRAIEALNLKRELAESGSLSAVPKTELEIGVQQVRTKHSRVSAAFGRPDFNNPLHDAASIIDLFGLFIPQAIKAQESASF